MKIPEFIVGLDFETYYDKDYTLRKLATSDYVRHQEFKAHGISIRASDEKKAKWYPHDEIPEALDQFEWSTSAVLCHNTAFDGLILTHHYGVTPAFYYDTLSMARPLVGHDIGTGLDEVSKYFGGRGKQEGVLEQCKGLRDLPPALLAKLGKYANQDVDEMWRIFTLMLKGFPPQELEVIHHTIRAFTEPTIVVDVPRAEKELQRELAAKEALILGVSTYTKTKDDYEKTLKVLGSSNAFANALRAAGAEPPTKYSEKQHKDVYAFAKGDLEFQALQEHPKKSVRQLVEARLASKATNAEAKAARLIHRGQNGMRLPIMLNYARAHTLRWSGGDKLNPQNFKRGSELRKCLKAPRGYKIVVVDSSQIEARMNAWLAEDYDKLEIFRKYDEDPKKNPDPYCILASKIYARPITKKDTRERFVGKVGELGLGFQMGAEKYQYTLAAGIMGPPAEIDIIEAQKVVDVYRAENWRIRNQWKLLNNMLGVMLTNTPATYRHGLLTFGKGKVRLPNGLHLHYPELRATWNERFDRYDGYSYRSSFGNRTKIYGGLFTENIVQCLARIVVAEQALRIAEQYRIVLLVHDEVVFLAPTKQAEKAYQYGLKCLTEPLDWCHDLPLAAEGGWDDVYSK